MNIAPDQLEKKAVEPEADEATATLPADEELVVEDISIDGMCGVY